MSIEQEETGLEVHAKLPGSATAFAVPDEFLRPATTYKIAIGIVARGGNKTVTESSFITAANGQLRAELLSGKEKPCKTGPIVAPIGLSNLSHARRQEGAGRPSPGVNLLIRRR